MRWTGSEPSREAFDPKCTEWTTFSEIRQGDLVDEWGAARPVLERLDFPNGTVRILVANENGGIDLALAPGDGETWRVPREGEQRPVPCGT